MSPTGATASEPELVAVARTELRAEISNWSTPLPAPAMLREYEEILPGSTERIMQLAEVRMKGRYVLDGRLVDAEVKGLVEGRRMIFVLVLIAMSASIAFFAGANEVAGITLVSMPVVLLVRSILSR